AAASGAGLRLIAPRRVPGTGFSNNPGMHPDRRRAVAALEGDAQYAHHFKARRCTIERYFGFIASAGGGLHALPAWARRPHRVRPWVGAKLVLIVARAKTTRNPVAA